MSFTSIDAVKEDYSSIKKKGFYKISGLKKGHFIKVFINEQEGSDSDGERIQTIRISSVKRSNGYVQITSDDACPTDALEMREDHFYKRTTKRPECKSKRRNSPVPYYHVDRGNYYETFVKIDNECKIIRVPSDQWSEGDEIPAKYVQAQKEGRNFPTDLFPR